MIVTINVSLKHAYSVELYLLISLPSITGGLVVLDSNRGPAIVITMAPMGAVMTMDIMQTVKTISAYSRSSAGGSVPAYIFLTSSRATGPNAACKQIVSEVSECGS